LVVAQASNSTKRKRRFEDVPSNSEFAPREKKQDRSEEKVQLREQALNALDAEPEVIIHTFNVYWKPKGKGSLILTCNKS